MKVFGKNGEKDFEHVPLDSGATYSVMREGIARELCDITPFFDGHGNVMGQTPVSLPDGEHQIVAIGRCLFQTSIDGSIVTDEAWVVDKLKADFIVGAHTLQEGKINLIHARDKEGGDRIELGEMDTAEIW